MKSINWNTDKRLQLIEECCISFEQLLLAVSQGALLDFVEHPNRENYPNQRKLVVRVHGCVLLVPFVETKKEIFLKNDHSKPNRHQKVSCGGKLN